MADNTEKYISLSKFADLVGCTRQTIYRFVKEGKIKAASEFNIDGKSNYRFREDQVADARLFLKRRNAVPFTTILCIAANDSELKDLETKAMSDFKSEDNKFIDTFDDYVSSVRERTEGSLKDNENFRIKLANEIRKHRTNDLDKYSKNDGDEALDVLVGFYDNQTYLLELKLLDMLVDTGKMAELKDYTLDEFVDKVSNSLDFRRYLIRKYHINSVITSARYNFISDFQKMLSPLAPELERTYNAFVLNYPETTKIIKEHNAYVIAKAVTEAKLFDFLANYYKVTLEYISEDVYKIDSFIEMMRSFSRTVIGDSEEERKNYYSKLIYKENADLVSINLDGVVPTLIDILSQITPEKYPYGTKITYMDENLHKKSFVIGGKLTEIYESCKNDFIRNLISDSESKNIFTIEELVIQDTTKIGSNMELNAKILEILNRHNKQIYIYGGEKLPVLCQSLLAREKVIFM